MRNRGRPIATANRKNVAYMLDYFNRLLILPKETNVFFRHPHALDEARTDFEKVNALAAALTGLEKFDQDVENKYHLAFAYWIDTHLTEVGFQRCLNGFNQITYRKKSEKRTHIHIRTEANQTLVGLAKRLGLSKQDALDRIIEHAENTL